ncbi:MAG: hypothetical protein WA936_10170 [Erythrobacter sp.]
MTGLLLLSTSKPVEARALPGELAEKDRAIILQPASPWQLEMGKDRCRLSRWFDSPDGPGMVVLEQIAPGSTFDLTVAGPDFASSHKGSWFYGGMRSDREMATIDPLEYDVPGYGDVVTLADVSIEDDRRSRNGERALVAAAIDPEAANLAERIVLQRSTRIVSLETGSMKEPFEALNVCSNDLLPIWGLDIDVHRAFRPARMPGERAYFKRLHHELASKPGNEGHKALLRVRAMVAADGSVSDCLHEYALSSVAKSPTCAQTFAR